ncbi:MAG: YicC family protein [Pseudomonadales bacterium]|jgi:uncharacterized protein (TIGR00255 family)|nr:YicC family protein [Pseudomonadales bacterium]MCP5333034.1 YicC family protein [Pseudomonadales bacterium]HMW15475.1 YicC family protein [Pseudomonadales bacterium]HMW84079.1 YicC family protein [Pseudomonadales bacterium]HMY97624.1 YicC family protein [Pseudomonadales bacterium]
MVASMTAYARCESNHAWGNLTWELRSVNHRYLELSLRLPEAVREIEQPLRQQLRGQLARGKVDATLSLKLDETAAHSALNSLLLEELAGLQRQLLERLPTAAPLSVHQLLQWPGVICRQQVEQQELTAAALALFENTLRQLGDQRDREGSSLSQLLRQRLDAIGQQVAVVQHHLPEAAAQQRARLLNRLREVSEQFDPQRLEQELLLLAQKSDVAEELDRLTLHLHETREVLRQGGAIGRRLDFIMQELNREANTLGAKSTAAPITRAVVEIKVLVEQMREQVQNLE